MKKSQLCQKKFLCRLCNSKKLKVAILSTGDEVYDPGNELPYGGIYDSNRFMVVALLEALGCDVAE